MVLLFLQKNNLSFSKSQTSNASFKYSYVIFVKDYQFVFPDFSFFHLSQNFTSTLSSQ